MSIDAYEILGEDRPSRWLVTCDHATNRVPPEVGGGSLGLPESEMRRHIAYDVGAAGVSRRLAERLEAPAILSRFSRLVIDPNRGEDDPTLIMKVYDHTIIPGNRRIDGVERERRLEAYYRPYHDALAHLAARRDDAILIAVHSFTPRLAGRSYRPWHVGILHAWDQRISGPLLARLRADSELCVGENQPYAGHLPGDSVDRHGLKPGRPNALIELRHDLIETEEQQAEWGDRLAGYLTDALAASTL